MDARQIATEEVRSSNIAALGYDEETKVAVVEFHNGAKYAIEDMERADFEALRYAPSIGKHFHAVVKPNYSITRL